MSQSKITSFFVKPHSNLERQETNHEETAEDKYTMFFDGCSKGNPGIAGAGAVLYKNGLEIWSKSLFVGEKETNNVAEYHGLILGLEEAVRQNIKRIEVKGDSELVIKQMKCLYKVKSPNMVNLYQKAKVLERNFDKITFFHVYRSENSRADELSNQSIMSKKL
jgi:ribonuclease HI